MRLLPLGQFLAEKAKLVGDGLAIPGVMHEQWVLGGQGRIGLLIVDGDGFQLPARRGEGYFRRAEQRCGLPGEVVGAGQVKVREIHWVPFLGTRGEKPRAEVQEATNHELAPARGWLRMSGRRAQTTGELLQQLSIRARERFGLPP